MYGVLIARVFPSSIPALLAMACIAVELVEVMIPVADNIPVRMFAPVMLPVNDINVPVKLAAFDITLAYMLVP